MGICQIGSEPSPGKSGRVWLDDGFFCTLLGVRSPLCRMIDRIWEKTAQALSLANPNEAPRTASKFLWSWAKGFAKAAIEDAATSGMSIEDLCAQEVLPPAHTITYLDLVAFLIGESDALLDKIYDWWKYRAWMDNCRCKPNPVHQLVADVSLPDFSDVTIPYCGGFVTISKDRIQNCASSLMVPIQGFINQSLQAQQIFQQELALIDPDEWFHSEGYGHWEFEGGYIYEGEIGSGYIHELTPDPGATCPTEPPSFGSDCVTCHYDDYSIRVCYRLLAGQSEILRYHSRALSDLVDSEGNVGIPQGTNLTSPGAPRWEYTAVAGVCWYVDITLHLPPCEQGGSNGYWTTSTGVDGPQTDDMRLCEDFPELCLYKVPSCCGEQSVLLTSDSVLDLAEALGFETAPYRSSQQ